MDEPGFRNDGGTRDPAGRAGGRGRGAGPRGAELKLREEPVLRAGDGDIVEGEAVEGRLALKEADRA